VATRDEEAPVQQELEIDNLVDALIEREGGAQRWLQSCSTRA
jgi:hypothetical protein